MHLYQQSCQLVFLLVLSSSSELSSPPFLDCFLGRCSICSGYCVAGSLNIGSGSDPTRVAGWLELGQHAVCPSWSWLLSRVVGWRVGDKRGGKVQLASFTLLCVHLGNCTYSFCFFFSIKRETPTEFLNGSHRFIGGGGKLCLFPWPGFSILGVRCVHITASFECQAYPLHFQFWVYVFFCQLHFHVRVCSLHFQFWMCAQMRIGCRVAVGMHPGFLGWVVKLN